ncbi:MAG: hypothetical protein AAGI30_03915 [Planctomycetota bacterium]
MSRRRLGVSFGAAVLVGGVGLAEAVPPLAELGSGLEVMNHVFVVLGTDNAFDLFVQFPEDMPATMYRAEEDAYVAPYDAAHGRWVNGQYGWLYGGSWVPPPGALVWIELVDADEGIETRFAIRSYAEFGSFSPIYGSEGSPPRIWWDTRMLHTYHLVDEVGLYRGRYRVYLGDPGGEPLAGYDAGEIELTWLAGACDRDGDGDVDGVDVLAWLDHQGDVDLDGLTDAFDLAGLAAAAARSTI